MNEEVERMAREYKQALALSADETTTVEQLVLLEENQLELLNDLSSLRSNLTARTVGYLKNLIFRSLQQLNALVGNTSYIPSVRNNVCPLSAARAVINLYDQQLSIFILLDKLSSPPPSLIAYENRKMSLIVALLR